MSRKLLALNLALLALIAAAGWQLQTRWQKKAAAQEQFLGRKFEAAPAPVVLLPTPPPPTSPAVYATIATQLLFSKDRNPTVVIETPQPKKMPGLPRYYGQMNFGGGPRVVLADAPGGKQKTYLMGEKIGEFVLAGISRTEIVFEWDGKKVPAKLEDLKDLTKPAEPTKTTATTAAQPTAVAAKPAATNVGGKQATGPGQEVGEGYKACQPGDPHPNGAIVDGYRKIMASTPFGTSCRWVRVQ